MNLLQNIGYVAYRLPDESDHYVCAIDTIEKRSNYSDISAFDFIIAPYNKSNQDSFLLKFNKIGINADIPETKLSNGIFNDTTKKDYLQSCQSLIQKLSHGTLSKVVLSRTKSIETNDINLDELFRIMKDSYPKAFIYIFHHPQIGTWAAATPELLLSSDGVSTQTVALAGTREYNSLSDTEWGDKEIDEHRYIEKFINEKLESLGIQYSKTDTYTQPAGNVEHIKSIYNIEINNHNFIDIADSLHPGPAISGYPIKDAMDAIESIETHDRLFYCGYLGLQGHMDKKHLYINLRCMEIFSDGYKVYIGGGITSESNAHDEWTETELKSETLSDILLSANYEEHK